MTWLMYILSVYLTYYTYTYARVIWKNGNKTGSIAVGVLAVLFFPLAVAIDWIR